MRRKLPATDVGGLVSFEGRGDAATTGPVRSLEYEVCGELAEKEGEQIMAEARKKLAVLSAAGGHHSGHLRVEELAVWAGVPARASNGGIHRLALHYR